ncbi:MULTISPECIES: hypothetical protein [Spirosoma]|uniref:Uncharacterized protein n=1 Tax=Spirosoma liriopis TaxID=2937440 RepID=A0ABT0HNL3_9BACT|nr:MULTISPECIES: hypothetical protein [Spirosoma]MCK8493238.1 hypothetical protein [Spirosoma liriopis]UHG92632.1 hypothetical protein LQ777_06925 [Spirosoma oryzicola]
MENNNNSSQQPVDQNSGGPLEGMSPQHTNMPANNDEEDAIVYAGLGVNNEPDIMNPGDEEASDTLLYTDTITAMHATDEVRNSEDLDALPDDLLEDISDDELDNEISELAEEEEEGNERY